MLSSIITLTGMFALLAFMLVIAHHSFKIYFNLMRDAIHLFLDKHEPQSIIVAGLAFGVVVATSCLEIMLWIGFKTLYNSL